MTMRKPHDPMQDLIAEQAAEWYVEHRDGTLDAARTREFMRWLKASPAHVAEYLSIAGMAQEMAGVAQRNPTTIEELITQIEAGSNVHALTPSPRDHGEREGVRGAKLTAPNRHWPRALAAGLVIAIAATLWLLPQRGAQHFETRHGEQRTWQLPDNTIVRLNSDSAIAVRFDDARRNVEVVRGQVYFEIAEDEQRPFNVRAGDYLIEDIGTAFDVYRQEAETTVTVVEGRVRVWGQAIPPSLPAGASERQVSVAAPLADLHAGAQARIAVRSGTVEALPAVNVQKATAWVQEKIVFESDAIATVAAEFNRYNRQQIVIDDPRVGAIPISGVFRSYDVQSFVDFLNGLPGVRARIESGRIVVSRETQAG
jgi:transmembrane sensor